LQGKRIIRDSAKKIDWPYELKPEELESSITDRYIQPLLDGQKETNISDALYEWAYSIDNLTKSKNALAQNR